MRSFYCLDHYFNGDLSDDTVAKLYGIILLACPVRGSERVQGRRHEDTLNVLSDQQAVGENYNMIRSGGLIII